MCISNVLYEKPFTPTANVSEILSIFIPFFFAQVDKIKAKFVVSEIKTCHTSQRTANCTSSKLHTCKIHES